MKKLGRILLWLVVATLGAGCAGRARCVRCTVHAPRPVAVKR